MIAKESFLRLSNIVSLVRHFFTPAIARTIVVLDSMRSLKLQILCCGISDRDVMDSV